MNCCKCGCGREANYGGWVKSHWNKGKVAWNRGRPMPEEQKIKMIKKLSEKLRGENHPLYGKNHSVETKLKINQSLLGFKHTEESRKKMSLKHSMENNANWKGGKSFELYGVEFNNKLKEQIRNRDQYVCRLCSKKQEKRKHHIHHIDYDKQNNDPINLITLCIKCHLKTNFVRFGWEDILSSLNKFNHDLDFNYESISLTGGMNG
tara:strand:+ start:6147 stop:6764 length:618 start_codon:yes stop_codon:yes gene_type:complete